MLSPDVVAAIEDLGLAARLVVEGLRAGGHRSPFHGYSAEFQQHRAYRPGDDLKYLDWKILARTDRLYSRQFRETTSMSVMIVLDCSASMAFPESGVSKFQYARILAAALAHLTSTQGDAVGLMTFAQDRLTYVPARGGRPHLQLLLTQLERLTPAGQWQPRIAIARGAGLLRRRGLVIVISDFYDDEEDTRREVRRVARSGHDVAMLQVISPDEETLPFTGALEIEDMETGERRMIDTAAALPAYRTALRDFLDRCAQEARRDGVDYALMNTHVPPARALRGFLARRGAPS